LIDSIEEVLNTALARSLTLKNECNVQWRTALLWKECEHLKHIHKVTHDFNTIMLYSNKKQRKRARDGAHTKYNCSSFQWTFFWKNKFFIAWI